MKKEAIVYTSAALNGSLFLTTIDTAIWLHKSDGFKKVTICCVPNYNPFNFFTLILRFKNLFSYIKKNKLKKYRSFLKSDKSKKNNFSGLASFATGNSDFADMTIGDLEIKFLRLRTEKKGLLKTFFKLSYKTVYDYFYYFRKKCLKNRSYLNYRVKNIYAGLNILSEALRSDYKSFGSIFHCRLGILAALYRLHISNLEYGNILIPKDTVAFVCGPDQEYLYGFFSRYMSNKGACYIETSHFMQPYIKLDLESKFYSRRKISEIEGGIQEPEKEKIIHYYKKRIEKPWEALNYKFEKYSSSKRLANIDGMTVILYLHSFTDAQYVFGYDGYHDLMDWCLSTISSLNSNQYISRVIVKPHPESTSSYHPGDAIANKYLKSKLPYFDKVQWADSHFGVNHINNPELVVGITHHGSVAEELAFSKIPVIASAHAFWGKEYKFGYWWDNVQEYEALISGKSITELKVTETQTNELYRYAMDLHFRKDKHAYFDNNSTWRDLFEYYNIEDCKEHGENMEQIKRLVSKLDPKSINFKNFVKTRLQRINKLIEIMSV